MSKYERIWLKYKRVQLLASQQVWNIRSPDKGRNNLLA